MNSDCPSRMELSDFALGNLAQPMFDRVAEHVGECATCAAVLETLDALTDPLIQRLRAPAKIAADEELIPPTLLDAALAARETPETGLPRRLGKFELVEELGVGSFGHVFRARDTELQRTVAIKVLRDGRLASHEDVDRFLREARSAAQLQHPGIVQIHDSGQTEGGTCYLVEEFVPGETLARQMRAQRPGLRQAAELVARVAEALDYAHRQGIVHRDVTPSNILLDPDDRPHVMDFGLAKRETDEPPVTPDGQVLGTPAYMSPEQAAGESHRVDARSDVYSLGVILYELLTGERPFHGNRRMLMLQVLHDEPRPPRRLNDKAPRDLETICLKAMAKDPRRRYAAALELADDLRRWASGEPIRARTVGRAERLWRWCRRNPMAAGLIVAVTLGSASGMGYLSRLSKQLVESTALQGAAQQAEMLEEVNETYTSEVVDRVMPRGVVVTHDYATRPGAIPLPATLTHVLGRQISVKSPSGMQVRLYSDHPFRTRTDGGPKDDFERDALARLRKNPDQPVYSFEDFLGQPSLRYAIARRMQQTCINCHNFHPDSNYKNWRVGDVRGVVEIIRPLARDVARAREGLREAFIVMGTVSIALLGLSVLILVARNRRLG